MTDNDEVWPPKCPNSGSNHIKEEKQSEYTGGGYADYWYEFQCQKCTNIWRSTKKTSYF